jgi:hypothetical protein
MNMVTSQEQSYNDCSVTFGFVLEYGMKLNSWFHGDTRRSRQ